MRYFVIVRDNIAYKDAIPVTVFIDYHMCPHDADSLIDPDLSPNSSLQFVAGPLEEDGSGFITGLVSECQLYKVM